MRLLQKVVERSCVAEKRNEGVEEIENPSQKAGENGEKKAGCFQKPLGFQSLTFKRKKKYSLSAGLKKQPRLRSNKKNGRFLR